MSRSRLQRPTLIAVGILLALAAAVIRGPIRRALRQAPPANRHQDETLRSVRITTVIDGDTVVYDYTYDPMGRLLTVTKDSTLVEE